ncbi:MAG TPA: response regulator [Flavisolibacter sp.]
MKRYKIIIVENDEDEQLFMKEGFETANLFEVIAVVLNGDTLFEWLTQNVNSLPDIILSDLNMPGKNGYDVIKEVKSNPLYSHIPVVITSTSSTRTIMEKCITAGASEYIVKPETFIEYVPYVKDLYNRVEEKQLVK